MSAMTPERLADIRERHSAGLGLERPGDVAALLAEVERLHDEVRRGPRQEPNRWCPKMLRERLCQQQTFAPDDITRDEIGGLIALLDLHRPIGPDGKHGKRHTPTCGCEDDERGQA